MSNELTRYNEPELVSIQKDRFELEQRMANLFVSSGLFSDIKGHTAEQAIAQAYVKIAMGNSMGFSPAESMQGIDIIQGKPVVGSQLRAARMQRAGYGWSIDRLDNKGCELTIRNGTGVLGKAVFLEDDARAMGLLAKDNWKKDPSSMYFARAITRAQRRYAPGVLSLDIPTPDEAYDLSAADVISLPSQDSVGAALATANKTEVLKGKIEKKKEALPPAAATTTDAPWGGVPQESTAPAVAPSPAPAAGQYPFGRPYAELDKWQKEILGVMANLKQEKSMAALSTAGIMSLEEITVETSGKALDALRKAAELAQKDLF